jgi:hypothetical protein
LPSLFSLKGTSNNSFLLRQPARFGGQLADDLTPVAPR